MKKGLISLCLAIFLLSSFGCSPAAPTQSVGPVQPTLPPTDAPAPAIQPTSTQAATATIVSTIAATPTEVPTSAPTAVSVDLTAQNWIAVTGTDDNIWLVSIDGGTKVQITKDGSSNDRYSQPKWSPDGSRLAYMKTNKTAATLYLFALDTQTSQALAENLPVNEHDTHGRIYDWSFEGTEMVLDQAYEIDSSGNVKNDGLLLLDLQTKEMKNLISLPGKYIARPDWASNINFIGFTACTPGAKVDTCEYDLMDVDDPGKITVEITNGSYFYQSAYWTPSGSWIWYYTCDQVDPTKCINDRIFVKNIKGKILRTFKFPKPVFVDLRLDDEKWIAKYIELRYLSLPEGETLLELQATTAALIQAGGKISLLDVASDTRIDLMDGVEATFQPVVYP